MENKSILRAVASIANARGGEVFVGVTDDKRIQGITTAPNELTDILRQPKADRGPWYCVDLNETLLRSTPVPHGERNAFVLEIANPGIPSFVLEDGHLELYVRSGDQSLKTTAFGGLEWSRSTARARILRTIFKEYETAVAQLDFSAPQQSIAGGLALPFLQRCMEDGTFYAILSHTDRNKLLGYNPRAGSHTDGVLSPLYHLRFELEAVFRRQHDESAVWDWGEHMGHSSYQKLEQGLDRLKKYLSAERIDTGAN